MNNMNIKNIFILFLLYTLCAVGQQKTPSLNAIVADNAHIFTGAEKEQLIDKLRNFETETTHQLVVLTIKNLNGESIEEYALNVFNKNKLGQKKLDNGILLLFSLEDRKVRIEVGYGLEPVITDALASRIIRTILIPNFKKENYYKGINEATSKIIEFINSPNLIDDFVIQEEEIPTETSYVARFFTGIFLAPVFFLLSYFGFNRMVSKHKKINIKTFYKKNTRKFYLIMVLGVLSVILFLKYFLIIFGAILYVSFLSMFLYVGAILIFKELYDRLFTLLKGLFTGKLGVLVFPFFLPKTILLFIASLVFTFAPLLTIVITFLQAILKIDINSVIPDFDPFYILYFIIGAFLTIVAVTCMIVIYKIKNSFKDSFGFSFFKISAIFSTGNSSRNHNSNGSRSYSSSGSSSSSFSGGGGSSGGGGASGSW